MGPRQLPNNDNNNNNNVKRFNHIQSKYMNGTTVINAGATNNNDNNNNNNNEKSKNQYTTYTIRGGDQINKEKKNILVVDVSQKNSIKRKEAISVQQEQQQESSTSSASSQKYVINPQIAHLQRAPSPTKKKIGKVADMVSMFTHQQQPLPEHVATPVATKKKIKPRPAPRGIRVQVVGSSESQPSTAATATAMNSAVPTTIAVQKQQQHQQRQKQQHPTPPTNSHITHELTKKPIAVIAAPLTNKVEDTNLAKQQTSANANDNDNNSSSIKRQTLNIPKQTTTQDYKPPTPTPPPPPPLPAQNIAPDHATPKVSHETSTKTGLVVTLVANDNHNESNKSFLRHDMDHDDKTEIVVEEVEDEVVEEEETATDVEEYEEITTDGEEEEEEEEIVEEEEVEDEEEEADTEEEEEEDDDDDDDDDQTGDADSSAYVPHEDENNDGTSDDDLDFQKYRSRGNNNNNNNNNNDSRSSLQESFQLRSPETEMKQKVVLDFEAMEPPSPIKKQHLNVLQDLRELMQKTKNEKMTEKQQIMKEKMLRDLLESCNTWDQEARTNPNGSKNKTGLSAEEVADIVTHINLCEQTNTPIRWDLINDVIFPNGIEEEPEDYDSDHEDPYANKVSELYHHITAHGDRDNAIQQSSSQLPEVLITSPTDFNNFHVAELSNLTSNVDNQERFRKKYDLTKEEMSEIISHITLCEETNTEVRWDLVRRIIYPEESSSLPPPESAPLNEIDACSDDCQSAVTDFDDAASEASWFSIYPEFDDCASSVTFLIEGDNIKAGKLSKKKKLDLSRHSREIRRSLLPPDETGIQSQLQSQSWNSSEAGVGDDNGDKVSALQNANQLLGASLKRSTVKRSTSFRSGGGAVAAATGGQLSRNNSHRSLTRKPERVKRVDSRDSLKAVEEDVVVPPTLPPRSKSSSSKVSSIIQSLNSPTAAATTTTTTNTKKNDKKIRSSNKHSAAALDQLVKSNHLKASSIREGGGATTPPRIDISNNITQPLDRSARLSQSDSVPSMFGDDES